VHKYVNSNRQIRQHSDNYGDIIEDPMTILQTLNDHFTSVYTVTSLTNYPLTSLKYNSTMDGIMISELEVSSQLQRLNPN
jgi:hypothetical protein